MSIVCMWWKYWKMMGYCMPPRNQPWWECLHHGNWQMIQITLVCLEKWNSEVANVRTVSGIHFSWLHQCFWTMFWKVVFSVLTLLAYSSISKQSLPQSIKARERESCSVMSDSSRTHGLYSPWNSPGQNTGGGSHARLQGIFPIVLCLLIHSWP